MRLLITADLHVNHPRSRPLAIDLIDRMNQAGGDAVLLVGDTAVADGDDLEHCLTRFKFKGPKLFLCGNHELWTQGPDSHRLFTLDLPQRIRALGWHWLETDPFITPSFAITGAIGWYDYSFASDRLAIPKRFYQAKLSPGAAEHLGRADLLADRSDITPQSFELVARWNDGQFVKLHRSDEEFLEECLARLSMRLQSLAHLPRVIVATHHVPFHQLLPPGHSTQIEFVKAYLGSEKLGHVIRAHANVTHVFCGHSHFATKATIGSIHAINIGSGYRHKTFETLDLPD